MTPMAAPRARILVFSSLFPSAAQPTAGIFIRERMFRVARRLPLSVVAPMPWFPGQGLIRRVRPHYRLPAPALECQEGIEIYRPRFLASPGVGRGLDSLSMAMASLLLLMRLKKQGRFNLIDAHFAYPDGHAATLLGRWLSMPVTVTVRGTEVPHARTRWRRTLMLRALTRAQHIFSVSESLRTHLVGLGVDRERIQVVGNGVDCTKFRPISRDEARAELGIDGAAPVLVSVGGLVERKGFHRVIECLPDLLKEFPALQYLVIGGPGAEGDWRPRLEHQVGELRVQHAVRFLGPIPQTQLHRPLSAADVFVLSTRNEGWANVFLEAMACGLPVVTTDVGGNREVVRADGLGTVVAFGDRAALRYAVAAALRRDWDRAGIRAYAQANDWEGRVAVLCERFERVVSGPGEWSPTGTEERDDR